MGKKASRSGQADLTRGDPTVHVTRGESLLDDGDFRGALTCFEAALELQPSLQTGWYLRGVSCAELWEIEQSADNGSNKGGFLQVACESWRQVLTLDTSTRAETRYLACLACAKLLTKAAADFEDDDDDSQAGQARATESLVDALRGFDEALRLHQQWGHAALDGAAWGSWGEALSQSMRLEASRQEACGWPAGFSMVSSLCETASEKFGLAVQAAVDPEDFDESDNDDTHWLTLHVEHLLAFVDISRKTLMMNNIACSDLGELGARAAVACQQALTIADANARLLDGLDGGAWEHLALRGDALGGAAALLGALSVRATPNSDPPRLALQETALSSGNPMAGVDAATVMLAADQNLTQGQSVSEAEAEGFAETAFIEAMARGGREAAASVGISLGELYLERARRMRLRAAAGSETESMSCLRRASEVFQGVTSLRGEASRDPPQARSVAWYNLACIAGLLGKPEHAARALRSCLQQLPAGRRERWRAEARADADLVAVQCHPDVQASLVGP